MKLLLQYLPPVIQGLAKEKKEKEMSNFKVLFVAATYMVKWVHCENFLWELSPGSTSKNICTSFCDSGKTYLNHKALKFANSKIIRLLEYKAKGHHLCGRSVGWAISTGSLDLVLFLFIINVDCMSSANLI